MTGVAVNVTDVPAHIGPIGTDAMLTLADKFGLTVIEIAFEVAGLPVVQVALEVISQVTMSPGNKMLLTKTGLLVPMFPPFTFH